MTSGYWAQFKMPQVAFQLENGQKKVSKMSLWSSLLSTNRFRKIVGKAGMSDRYHLCLPTIEPLAKVIDLATPLEREDHQQPENFDVGRVQSVLAPNAMVAHNIKATLEAAVMLQKRAAANISTAKKHRRQEVEALKESQMVKAFSSEKKVLDQLCDFIADQKEQAVNMYVCVCDYVISFCD